MQTRKFQVVVAILGVLLTTLFASSSEAMAASSQDKQYVESYAGPCHISPASLAKRTNTDVSSWYAVSPTRVDYDGREITLHLRKDEYGFSQGDSNNPLFTGQDIISNALVVGCYWSKGGILFTHDLNTPCMRDIHAIRSYFGGESRYWSQELDERYLRAIYVYQAPKGQSLTFDDPLGTTVTSTAFGRTVKFTPGYRITSRNFEAEFFRTDC